MIKPEITRDAVGLRSLVAVWRDAKERIALVPTMGALHEGHLALIHEGRKRAGRVIVSIFVNPAQFAPNEDFLAYPRTLERDLDLLASVGTDLVYAPAADVMYPPGFAESVCIGGPALAGLEDSVRPQFFSGVATIVAKLLMQCAPDEALFGEKDYQQLLVVRRMARDLDLPLAIVGVPTSRESDGLARSSRNVYLSEEERRAAGALPRVLEDCRASLRRGRAIMEVLEDGMTALRHAGFKVDYLVVRDAMTLNNVEMVGVAPLRLLVAARIGKTRLIDNVSVGGLAR
jgi:pantoate--beta-alanine ligase